MPIDDLPLPAVNFLNVLGVPWPYINEQTVWQFASLVRQFRQAVISTHQEATTAVQEIAKAHKGASTEAMTSGWAKLSAAHVNEITAGCTVLADALDAAGFYIVGQKALAIAALVEMAGEFFVDQAAAVLTLGLAEAALGLIIVAGRKVVQSLEMDLTQYIAGKVIEQAAKPLFAKIAAALAGLDWSQSGATAGASAGFSVNPAAVATQLVVLRGQATQLRSTASDLATAVRGLKF
jgi:hypothetical protein